MAGLTRRPLVRAPAPIPKAELLEITTQIRLILNKIVGQSSCIRNWTAVVVAYFCDYDELVLDVRMERKLNKAAFKQQQIRHRELRLKSIEDDRQARSRRETQRYCPRCEEYRDPEWAHDCYQCGCFICPSCDSAACCARCRKTESCHICGDDSSGNFHCSRCKDD